MEVLSDLQNQLDMLLVQPFAAPQSKQLSSLEHVLDLAPVEGQGAREVVEIGLADFVRERTFEVLLLGLLVVVVAAAFRDLCTSCCLRGVMLLEEIGPDCAAGLDCELFVVDGDEDAALECRVEGLHAVGRQDHVAVVVFEHAEEDADQLVALEFVQAALFQEHVCFVEQEDGVPARAHVEDALQLGLNVSRIEAQFASGHDIQRSFHLFGHPFCRQSFASPWRTRKKNNLCTSVTVNPQSFVQARVGDLPFHDPCLPRHRQTVDDKPLALKRSPK